jgi:hypothetical protein
MRKILFTAGLLLMVLVVAADCPAPEPPPPGTAVHFAVCTRAGTETGCVTASGDDGGLYVVSGVAPGIAAGQWLQGTASVTSRFTICMQGLAVEHFVPDPVQQPVTCH